MPSPRTSRQEDGSVLDSSEENSNEQELVTNTGQLIMPPPIALPNPLSIFQAYGSNQPISSSHGTLQARIELQREKIRALELAVEERRRTEQLRDRERRLRLPAEQRRVLDLQRDEQHQRDRQRQDEWATQAYLRYKAAAQPQWIQQKSLTQERIVAIQSSPVPQCLISRKDFMETPVPKVGDMCRAHLEFSHKVPQEQLPLTVNHY
jgi:hypothetical protein